MMNALVGFVCCVRTKGFIMAKKEELGTDSEGRYRRYIGWKWGNGRPIQHLFRLGKDKEQAMAANRRLEQLWDAVVAAWKRRKAEQTTDEPAPVWDDTTLAIGQAIAKGQTVATIYPPPEMENMAPAAVGAWLAALQLQFPFIGLKLPDDQQQAGIAGMRRQEVILENSRRFQERLLTTVGEVAGQTVHEALDAYCAHIATVKKDKDRPLQISIRLLKQHVENFPLSKLDADRIDAWCAYWEARPESKDEKRKEAGVRLAFTTCRNTLIVLRQFLRWVGRSKAFDWMLPGGYIFPRCKIEHGLPSDKVKKHRRRHWTVDELATIYKYAKPWERALILLGLNCGFSKAEIATLLPCEIVKEERVKKTDDQEVKKTYTFIKRDRRKTQVYGEWVLWDETLEALAYLRQFQKPDSVYYILNTEGGALTTKTTGQNENQVIKNHWDNLMKRIRADIPDFHVLPFKHLRKTAANMVRHLKVKGAVELAVMFLAHGERQDGNDSQLADYTGRPWRKLHKALLLLRKKLLPVFAVEDPWTYKMNTISPVQRDRVLELRRAGKTLKAVASETGLHEMTVGKICRGAGLRGRKVAK
jgi:hypothetical protein